MTENEFVRLELFESETEALQVKGLLEENGIEVRISGLEPSALGFAARWSRCDRVVRPSK